MQIELKDVGKKFYREWIFRKVTLTFTSPGAYVFVGPNGSGKSTLMLVLTGLLPPTHGTVMYKTDTQTLGEDTFYRYQSVVAPYMEVIEEFTLKELLEFHFSFKKLLPSYTTARIMELTYLEKSAHKYIKQFSSGMKQRLKLGLAFYTQSEVLFLDEPCANLDAQGIQWYRQEVQKVLQHKLVIIGSNQSYEYDFCERVISLEQYK